jgi:uncharacterized membrane protein
MERHFLFDLPEWAPIADLKLSTDASDANGFGSFHENEWFSVAWMPSQIHFGMAYKELYPITSLSPVIFGVSVGAIRERSFIAITVQSGIACSPQFVTFYTVQSGIAYMGRNTFHYIPYSLVSPVAHNLLRFIPYSLVSPMGRNSQYVLLYTIQSGIAGRPKFVTFYTIQSGIARRSQFAMCFNIHHTYSLILLVGRKPQHVSLYTIQFGIAWGTRFVTFYTTQSGITYGSQSAIRFVIYHTVLYRLGIAICNTFSLYIIQSDIICRVCFACGSQVAIRSMYTIQSGIAGGPQCVTCYTIRSGSALWVAIRNVFH